MTTINPEPAGPASLSDEVPKTEIGGHPAGLYVLFGAEMWERFSYYGMRALLVLYLTRHIHLDRKDALDIYAIYTGLVYLTPLLGGFLADKVLGQRKAILIGGIVMAMGHFAMAFEPLLELALGLLILGNGFFKPNISTMVGQLYPQGDARRDGAYTIFYMGINLGAFFSPLVCGTLGEKFGWHYGFGAAGVGMVLGLISFVAFQRQLVGGYPPSRDGSGGKGLGVMDWVHVILISLACLAFAYGAIEAWPAIRPFKPYLFYASGALATVAIGYFLAKIAVPATATDEDRLAGDLDAGAKGADAPLSRVDWQRIAVIADRRRLLDRLLDGVRAGGRDLDPLCGHEDRRVTCLGNPFPASWFQSVNPLLIFILAPLFSMLWTGLDRTRFKLNSAAKMGLGMLILGLGFVVMSGAEGATKPTGLAGAAMAGFGVSPVHPGGVVPVADRPVAGQQALAAEIWPRS